jgi:hypothetical protein
MSDISKFKAFEDYDFEKDEKFQVNGVVPLNLNEINPSVYSQG